MAVELDYSSVVFLHTLLSVEAVFEIIDVFLEFSDVGGIGACFPVVLADLVSVVSDLVRILLDFLLGIANSSNELCEDDSCGFDSNNLV